MMLVKLGRLIAIPLAVALLSGCPFSPKKGKQPPPPDPNPYQEQTSPAAVLHNLIKAYQERTLPEYRKLFDSEEFFFEFSQRDRDTDPTLPIEWDFDADQKSTETLFQDESVDKIVLRMTLLERQQATEADQLPGGPAGVWKVVAQNVHLEVHTTDDNGPLEYLVEADGADFFFREYPGELAPISRLPIWRIVRWRDKPAGSLFSFGEMKQRQVL